ncbi:MAG: hypothetical protein Q8O55_01370 [Dehalococcoidales bacterium]|nr:hypothetical protein [Dehalococcoidales bacterium]
MANKGLAIIGAGILAAVGLIALSQKSASADSGGGSQTGKPSYWASPPYPAFPPTWWLSSYNGQYVLMDAPPGSGQNPTWLEPGLVADFLSGGWTIVS